MELQKLRYFYAAARLEHVTRAAESMHVAQPALTQSIRSLEEELGAKLFVKNGRGITLTPAGEYLRDRLGEILPELDSLPEELARLQAREDRTVRLNILAASTFVINSIVEFRRENPEVIFDFEQSEEKVGCDIVIKTNGLRERGGWAERCVKEEKIYLAVPKGSAYARLGRIDLSAVRNEGFVMLTSSRLFGAICNKFCNAAGFFPKVLFESDSPAAVQNIIGTGTGVAFWPEYSWGEANNENVVLLEISSPICRRELIIERWGESAAAGEFYRFLTEGER